MAYAAKASRGALLLSAALGLVLVLAPGAATAAPSRFAAAKSPAAEACAFLKDLNGADPSIADTAVNLTAPGSNAAAYAIVEAGIDHAYVAEGISTVVPVKCASTTVQLTSVPPTTYTKFKVDKKGRLSDFLVSGLSLKGRLLVGSTQQASVLGVTIKLAAAYQSVQSGGSLFVVLGVTGAPDGQRELQTSQATYQSASGQTVQSSRSVGTLGELAQGVSTTLMVEFPSQQVGGTVTIPVQSADFSQTVNATIPIK